MRRSTVTTPSPGCQNARTCVHRPVSASRPADARGKVKGLLFAIVVTSFLPLAHVAAQEVDQEYDRKALATWVKAYTQWDEWDRQWLNTLQPDRHSGYLSRKKMPQPPAWLESACGAVFEADALLEKGCVLLRQSNERLWETDARRHKQAGIDAHEKPKHTSFIEHVHFDGGWIRPQSHARAFAPIGTHVSFMVGNRLELFPLPGVMLLRAPSSNTGNMQWMAAYDYGIGFRVADFQLPGPGQPRRLHSTLARAWMFERTSLGPVNGTIDL